MPDGVVAKSGSALTVSLQSRSLPLKRRAGPDPIPCRAGGQVMPGMFI